MHVTTNGVRLRSLFILSLAGNHLRRQISSYTSNPSWFVNVLGGCSCVVKLISSANEANNEMFPQSKDATDMSFRRFAAGLLQTSIAECNTDKDKLKLIHILVAHLSADTIHAVIQNVGQPDCVFHSPVSALHDSYIYSTADLSTWPHENA